MERRRSGRWTSIEVDPMKRLAGDRGVQYCSGRRKVGVVVGEECREYWDGTEGKEQSEVVKSRGR